MQGFTISTHRERERCMQCNRQIESMPEGNRMTALLLEDNNEEINKIIAENLLVEEKILEFE